MLIDNGFIFNEKNLILNIISNIINIIIFNRHKGKLLGVLKDF